ncbi:transmembrane protein 176A isoform X1 [Phyllostomus discolor]|uniref:Transmembrane protein 176A isoform X1 n=1 Tax=Phyllostomus discolor TaxID=89673 RepID=A0A7E6CIY4_9CHIR|nr:transmembrane protein 176A isoform X1 [Phyllostomus discolor]XP_035866938.1 transmembrane protein 176A isoform X1 [Phyllostomus discolor]XP_035866939.1 transmembrane protein 176A isoform X1 [Phyllostomus discolor]
MSTGMGTTAGDQVAPGAPQPTHIDVHIHQDPLLLNFLRQPSAPDYPTPSQPLGSKQVLLGSKRVLVASWVAQIILGLLSGALGGLGRFLYYDDWVIWFTYEAGIWTGAMAMLAGVTVFIFDKRGGTCWALLKTLFALASFATAIAAMQIGASHLDYLFYWPMRWCGLPNPWEPTLPPRDPEEARRKDLCLSYQYMIKNLSVGLQIILLSIWALLLLASLAPVLLFCWRRLRSKVKKDQKALLGSE